MSAEGAFAYDDLPPEGRRYLLKLYVTGSTTRSARAVRAITGLCEEYLPGQYELEIVDIYQEPEAAKDAQLLAAPTLIKELPLPLRRIIGDMSDQDRVMVGLGISPSS